MNNISFKERVKNTAINEARAYKEVYVDHEYLVCSDAFSKKDYYIIDAKEDNYQHLTGVNSLVSPKDFFDKCYYGTLEESDFDFIKIGQTEEDVKGTVRRKISVLSNIMTLFQNNVKVEETFVKNRAACNFAAADNTCTLGFINAPKSRPKTLMKGNELDANKMKNVNLLLGKKVEDEKFNVIIIGDQQVLMQYYEKIKNLVDESLIPKELDKETESQQETTKKQIASDLEKQLE